MLLFIVARVSEWQLNCTCALDLSAVPAEPGVLKAQTGERRTDRPVPDIGAIFANNF